MCTSLSLRFSVLKKSNVSFSRMGLKIMMTIQAMVDSCVVLKSAIHFRILAEILMQTCDTIKDRQPN